MNNRKTQVVSTRMDRWMVEAIDAAKDPFETRTDFVKTLVDEALRKRGLTPAIMRSRTEARKGLESHE
jgi:hypothetical protein